MLRLDKAQLGTLEDLHMQAYARRVCAFLRDNFSDAAEVPALELEAQVMEQLTRANRYGLCNEDQILIYVVTAWLLGDRFDEQLPAARLVLNDTDYSPEEKSEWLEDWTVMIFHRLSPHAELPTLKLGSR